MKVLLTLFLLAWSIPCFGDATYAFITSGGNSTDGTSFVFKDIPLCDGTTDCTIIVAWHTVNAGTTELNATIQVEGITAQELIKVRRPVTNTVNLGVTAINFPYNVTAGTITVSLSASVGRFQYGVHRITGNTPLPYQVKTSTANDPSVTIDVPAGGVAIGAAVLGNSGSATWTGLTERYDAVQESLTSRTGSGDIFSTYQDDLAVQCDFSTNFQDVMAVLSWGPRRIYRVD